VIGFIIYILVSLSARHSAWLKTTIAECNAAKTKRQAVDVGRAALLLGIPRSRVVYSLLSGKLRLFLSREERRLEPERNFGIWRCPD